MESEYIIVTTDMPPQRPVAKTKPNWRGGFETAGSSPVLGPQSAPTSDPAPTTGVAVVTVKLKPNEADDKRRDPNTRAMAEVMPVALVAPRELAATEADEALADAKAARCAWGIRAMGADKTSFRGEDVVVAVLDSGINCKHPAFPAGEIEFVKRNFTGGDANDVTDATGHGTHCAGTIFGRDVEGVRIGVAPGVGKALIAKVLNDAGAGSTAGVINALTWAFTEGANVVSLSLGFDFATMVKRLTDDGLPEDFAVSRTLQAYRDNMRAFQGVVDLLLRKGQQTPGAIVVAASGNDSRRERDAAYVIDVAMPAATIDVLSVGALMRKGQGFDVAPFSNVNPLVCAPGYAIVSADKAGGLIAKSGTSMACPHAAGAAALWWQQTVKADGLAKADTVQAKLIGRVIPLPLLARADRGSGMVRAPTDAD